MANQNLEIWQSGCILKVSYSSRLNRSEQYISIIMQDQTNDIVYKKTYYNSQKYDGIHQKMSIQDIFISLSRTKVEVSSQIKCIFSHQVFNDQAIQLYKIGENGKIDVYFPLIDLRDNCVKMLTSTLLLDSKESQLKYQSSSEMKIQSIDSSKSEREQLQQSNQKSSQIISLQGIQTFVQQPDVLPEQQNKYKFQKKIFNQTSSVQDQQISRPINVQTSNILDCSELFQERQQQRIPKASHSSDSEIQEKSINSSHQKRKPQKKSKIHYDSQQPSKYQNKSNQQWQQILDKLSNIQSFDKHRDEILNLQPEERLERLMQLYGEQITVPFINLYKKYLQQHEKRKQQEKQQLKKYYQEKIQQQIMKRYEGDYQDSDEERYQDQMYHDQGQMSGDDQYMMYEDNDGDSGDY